MTTQAPGDPTSPGALPAPSMPPRRITWTRFDGPMPANTKSVNRGTRWGNPFPAYERSPEAHAIAVDQYRRWLAGDPVLIEQVWQAYPRFDRERVLREATVFATHNAACACPPGWPCHGDTLLALGRGEPL